MNKKPAIKQIKRMFHDLGDENKKLFFKWVEEIWPLYYKNFEALQFSDEVLPEITFKLWYPILKLFKKPGKVLELCCGNGMVLKLLETVSGKKLEPYGVDCLEIKIKNAKNIIFPKYSENFKKFSVEDLEKSPLPFDFKFDYIICPDLEISHGKKNLEVLFNSLNSGGTLIIVFHVDSRKTLGDEKFKQNLRFLKQNGFELMSIKSKVELKKKNNFCYKTKK